MCEICERVKCPPRCPNHKREVYAWCDHCGRPIYRDEDWAVTTDEGAVFCSEACAKDFYGFNFIDWSEV